MLSAKAVFPYGESDIPFRRKEYLLTAKGNYCFSTNATIYSAQTQLYNQYNSHHSVLNSGTAVWQLPTGFAVITEQPCGHHRTHA